MKMAELQVDTPHISSSAIESEMEDDELEKPQYHQALVSNLNRCSGSALYTFGDNVVQCSIFGPNPMSGNLNLLKRNYFSVYLYPLGKIKNLIKEPSLTYYEQFFKRTFLPVVFQALLPRSRTYMVLNEIEKGSALLSTSLNAASLALLDSGYPLNYCIGACGVVLDKDGHIYSEREYQQKFTQSVRTYEPLILNLESPNSSIKATFCTVIKNTTLRPVSLVAEGRFSLHHLTLAQEKSVQPVSAFFDYVREFVKNRFV